MKRCAVVVALGMLSAQAAHAADVPTPQQEPAPMPAARPDWVLQVTPYLWASGLKGNISPFERAPTLSVDKSFSDIMEDLDFGGFANIWGRYDRFVFSADVMYVDTTGSHATGPLPALQIPGLGVPIPPGANVDATVDTKEFTATLLGGYRLLDTPGFTLDALGGARVWYISNDVTVTARHPLIGSRTATYGESFGWVDPVVGMRAFVSLTKRLSVQAQADIGGFGAGSDFTWSALATVNYAFANHFSVSAGYKVLDVDYDRHGHVFDARLSGPVLGVTYRF